PDSWCAVALRLLYHRYGSDCRLWRCDTLLRLSLPACCFRRSQCTTDAWRGSATVCCWWWPARDVWSSSLWTRSNRSDGRGGCCGHGKLTSVWATSEGELHVGYHTFHVMPKVRVLPHDRRIIHAPTKGGAIRPSIGEEDLRHERLRDVLCQTDEKQAL